MNHFDIADWTDFARGCVTAPDRAPMQAHLDGGCRRCRATVDMLQRIVTAVRAADALAEPPADIVRCAKAISALQRPRTASGGGGVGRPVYDNPRGTPPAGLPPPTPTAAPPGVRSRRPVLALS